MSTVRQKKLARKVVSNLTLDEPLNKGELVESVGYSAASATKKTNAILTSKGVQDELKKLGFDSDTAKSVVAEILVAGDSDLSRLAAAREIFKVNGDYAPEKSIHLNVETTTEKQIELAKQLHALKGRTTGS